MKMTIVSIDAAGGSRTLISSVAGMRRAIGPLPRTRPRWRTLPRGNYFGAFI